MQHQKRVAWAKEYVTWTAEDWKKVILAMRQGSPYSAVTEFAMFVDDQEKIALRNV